MSQIFRNVNDALPSLASDLLAAPVQDSRNGETRELTFRHITLTSPLQREVLVPTRKCNLAAQIFETMWVLSGRDDVESLGRYLPRAADFSDDGEVWRGAYGPRLRAWSAGWPAHGSRGRMMGPDDDVVDQLKHVINLLREDPSTRRAVMAIYDPATDCIPGKDIPCNDFIIFMARNGKLDAHVTIRSNDLVWGWSGINQFEWSVLLEIVAAYTDLEVGSLHFTMGSLHLYDRHYKRASTYRLGAAPMAKPSARFEPGGRDWDDLCFLWFEAEEKIRLNAGKHSLLPYVEFFPEPMLRSWLYVLAWWWTADDSYLSQEVFGTKLEAAARVAVQPKRQPPSGAELAVPFERSLSPSVFISMAVELHNEKHKAYGDSWKRRGEMLGILANIARKVDRLGGAETSDETSADTAMDLMIYLAKYRTWLADERLEKGSSALDIQSNTPEAANRLLLRVDRSYSERGLSSQGDLEENLRKYFDRLETLVTEKRSDRHNLVDNMLVQAYILARSLWEATQ